MDTEDIFGLEQDSTLEMRYLLPAGVQKLTIGGFFFF